MKTKPEPFFPPPTFDSVPDDPRKLKVTRPNDDGEILVRGAVPGREFRDGGDAPARPEPLGPEPLEPVGTVGWVCAKWPDYLLARRAHKLAIRRGALPPEEFDQAETDYWAYYAHRLTREERTGLANGRLVAIVRPVEPVWEKGDLLEITGKQSARVGAITRTLKGWRTEIVIQDFRTFYMKRTVGGSSQPKTDEQGYAADPTEGEIERARFDGAYTQTEDQAVPEGGEVLEDKLHRRLHAEASMEKAMGQAKKRKQATEAQLEAALAEARAKHRKSTARHLERRLASLRGKSVKRAA